MKKKQYKKFEKVEHPQPQKKVKLEVYDDGLYVGTINTDLTVKEGESIAKETLVEYVKQKMPSYRKKKYLTIRIA